MPSCVFDKCCGCIELKTGCFIIGYLNLVGVIIYTILSAVILFAGVAIATNAETDKEQEVGIAFTILGGIFFLFLLIALAFAIILLVGLHKNKPGHLKAYLVFALIFLIVMAIKLIAGCFNNDPEVSVAGTVIQNLVYIVTQAYYLLVLRSMYFRMKDPSRGPAIYSAA